MLVSLGRITIFTVVTLTLCTGLFLVAIWSVDDAIKYQPSLHVGFIETTNISADAVLVFDVETGTEIVRKNETQQLPIASVTKLFTASVFHDIANLTATTSILWSDVNTDGDAGRLHPHEVYSYRELTFPLLLESSNDAAVTMLRVEPDLLEKMNLFVQSHNATATHFEDTSGLSAKNVSTAHDLFLLTQLLFKQDPHIFDITRLKQFLGTHTGWLNNNPLVHQDGYRGGKHGYTFEANRTVVAFFDETIATGETRTVGYVLLGSDHLKEDIEVLRSKVRTNVTFN